VVNRKPAGLIADLNTLKATRVGVILGTSWAEAAAAAGVSPANTTQFSDLPAVLAALRAGKVAATVMSAPDFALAQKRDRALQGGIFIGAPNSAAWGLRKADTALLEALNDHILTLRKSRAWEQLVAKYFTPEAFDLFRRARRTQ
jgi:ABC-type amino acid transport substrate-binding protein